MVPIASHRKGTKRPRIALTAATGAIKTAIRRSLQLETSLCFLAVKDGNAIPQLYVFDISTWDGKMDLDLNDFWPDMGAISHVAIWNGPNPQPPQTQEMPEPNSLGLIILAIAGLRLQTRKTKKLE